MSTLISDDIEKSRNGDCMNESIH